MQGGHHCTAEGHHERQPARARSAAAVGQPPGGADEDGGQVSPDRGGRTVSPSRRQARHAQGHQRRCCAARPAPAGRRRGQRRRAHRALAAAHADRHEPQTRAAQARHLQRVQLVRPSTRAAFAVRAARAQRHVAHGRLRLRVAQPAAAARLRGPAPAVAQRRATRRCAVRRAVLPVPARHAGRGQRAGRCAAARLLRRHQRVGRAGRGHESTRRAAAAAARHRPAAQHYQVALRVLPRRGGAAAARRAGRAGGARHHAAPRLARRRRQRRRPRRARHTRKAPGAHAASRSLPSPSPRPCTYGTATAPDARSAQPRQSALPRLCTILPTRSTTLGHFTAYRRTPTAHHPPHTPSSQVANADSSLSSHNPCAATHRTDDCTPLRPLQLDTPSRAPPCRCHCGGPFSSPS